MLPSGLLHRLKLVDDDGKASLTNIALYLALLLVTYVTLIRREIDMTALGTLMTALSAYRAKAWQVDKSVARSDASAAKDARIQQLEAQVEAWKREFDRAALVPKARAGDVLPPGLR